MMPVRKTLVAALLCLAPTAGARFRGTNVRIMPSDKAQFLHLQKVDLRVEATPADANGTAVDGAGVPEQPHGEVFEKRAVRATWISRASVLLSDVLSSRPAGSSGGPI